MINKAEDMQFKFNYESESELSYLNNEFESLLSDNESNSELKEILENDNDFIECFLDNSGNTQILLLN
jgi:hypothetical protein